MKVPTAKKSAKMNFTFRREYRGKKKTFYECNIAPVIPPDCSPPIKGNGGPYSKNTTKWILPLERIIQGKII